MPSRSAMTIVVAVLASALSGCASSTAPPHWRPTATEAPTDPYGAWVTVKLAGDETPVGHSARSRVRGTETYPTSTGSVADYGANPAQGELLAVTADSLYLHDGISVRAILVSDIERATADWFEPSKQFYAWPLIGALSTASHGYILILSAPGWILFGSLAAASYSRTPLVDYPAEPLERLADYARFPRGIPPGLDLTRIAPKRR